MVDVMQFQTTGAIDRGATVRAIYMDRRLRAYLVHENELTQLTTLDRTLGVSGALCVFALSEILHTIWSINFAEGSTSFAYLWIGLWVIVALVSAVISVMFWRKRGEVVGIIKQESVPPLATK